MQKLLSIGVLDVVLQLPLSAHTHTHTVCIHWQSPRQRSCEAPPTSWLKACLNFCRQSTKSSWGGALERSVRTPSGGQRGKLSVSK